MGQLLAISDRNWYLRPHMYQAIMEGFKKSLVDPQTTFHIVKNGDQVVAFFRMDESGENERYFGSVNVKDTVQGYALAPALMEQMFKREADGYLVTAHCNPWEKVSAQYIGDSGFVATKIVDYSSQPAFEIERDGRVKNEGVTEGQVEKEGQLKYQYQKLSYAELLALSLNNPDQIRSFVFTSDAGTVSGDPENDRFIQEVNEQTSQGKVITNYRYNPADKKSESKLVLVAFEKR